MYWIERHWYRRTAISALLLPWAWLYRAIVALRRLGYRLRLLPSVRLAVPVVIIGNITVGGSGKTPLVLWLAQFLRAQGFRPGIVTRGYRGQASTWPQTVHADSDPALVGDEPVLLARASGCQVVADPDRVRGAERLVREHGCDLVLSDDGLQHYRLARDVEIAVIDGVRRFGNGWCLPAGPLREPISRLKTVDARIITQGAAAPGEWKMELVEQGFYRLGTSEAPAGIDGFHGKTVHAVAGIGHPARFFAQLRRLGLTPVEHAFPDHYRFRLQDFPFGAGHEVIMTEKDAVKCQHLGFNALGLGAWYLKVAAEPDAGFGQWLLDRLKMERRRG